MQLWCVAVPRSGRHIGDLDQICEGEMRATQAFCETFVMGHDQVGETLSSALPKVLNHQREAVGV